MQHSSNDQILDTQINDTRHQRIQLYRVVKARATPTPRQVSHLGPNSTEISSIDGGNQHN
jgi:hypothetical protein